MKLRKLAKRIVAFSLAAVMTVVAMPVSSVVEAATDSDTYPEEIRFPIEVLDFRADNLLFEYGEYYATPQEQVFDLYSDLYGLGRGKGLVEDYLGPDGNPVYKKETVEILAKYVQERLLYRVDNANVLDLNENHYLSMRKYIKNQEWYNLEAELGKLGGAAYAIDGNNCSGGSYVVNIGGNGQGTVTFQYYSNQARTRKIRIYYAQDDNRDFIVTVNGNDYPPVDCDDNNSWDTPVVQPKEVEVFMELGMNTIQISSTGAGNYAPNLDRIEVENWFEKEAEDCILAGDNGPNIQNNNALTFSNNAYINDIDENNTVTFTYNSESAGEYELRIHYATVDARYLNVSVNGGEATRVNCPANAQNWETAGNAPVTVLVNLVEGENTIVLSAGQGGNGWAPNLDKFDIYRSTLLGDYDVSKQKFDGNTELGWEDITTCMDYAYFVTSNLFNYHPSLNVQATDYKQLVFHKINEKRSKDIAYEFMADQNPNVKEMSGLKNKDGRSLDYYLSNDNRVVTEDGYLITDINGNAIYLNNDGSLRYADGTDTDPTTGLPIIIDNCIVSNNQINNFSYVPLHDDADLIYNISDHTIRNTFVDNNGDPINPGEIDTTKGDKLVDGGSLFLVDDLYANMGIERPYGDVDINRNAAIGGTRNFHYTVSSRTQFVYKKNAGQYFYFSGDDDVYVYVNGKLLVDLGGAHPQVDDEFNLDDLAEDLGLVDGEVVELAFFYMERQSNASNFYAKLNFKLAQDMVTHNFGYETIPYGFLANLDYSFSSLRQLNTNKAISFSDSFGNVIGAQDFILGEGVVLNSGQQEGSTLQDGQLSVLITDRDENKKVPGNNNEYQVNGTSQTIFDFANDTIVTTKKDQNGKVTTTQEALYTTTGDTITNTVMDGTGALYQTETYTFENNKITRIIRDKQGKIIETEVYEFDNVNNKVTSTVYNGVIDADDTQVVETNETIFDFDNKKASTTTYALDETGNMVMVGPTDEKGNVLPVVETLAHYKNNASMYEIFVAKIKVKSYFTNTALELNDTMDITGLQFDTSSKVYDTYDPAGVDDDNNINLRQVQFAVEVEYNAWMNGATVATEASTDYSKPVKVLVGRIIVRTSTDSMKRDLEDFGNFSINRYATVTSAGTTSYENQGADNVLKISTGELVPNDNYKETGVMTDVIINKLPIGIYTINLDTSVLTGYDVTIGLPAKDATGNLIYDDAGNIVYEYKDVKADSLELEPVYDNVNKTWSYPDVEFRLKAVRDVVPLKDLT